MHTVLRVSLTLLICLVPLAAFAQGSTPVPIAPNPAAPTGILRPPSPLGIATFPHDFGHPTEPWVGVPNPNRGIYGSVIRYIEVPPQQVVVNVHVPGPGSFSGGFEPQLFEIPGYVVTETTTGYIYPARVALQEFTPGVFQWVTEPSIFQRK